MGKHLEKSVQPENVWSEENLRKVAATAASRSEILRKIGRCTTGASFRKLTHLLKLYNIPIPRFSVNKTSRSPGIVRSNEDVFIRDSPAKTCTVRKRILKLRKHECEKCKRSEWEGLAIPLEVHHVNGINNDHRLENILLLCPNCHSQTNTFAGRSKKIERHNSAWVKLLNNLNDGDFINPDTLSFVNSTSGQLLTQRKKRQLWLSKLLPYACEKCQGLNEWEGDFLCLQVDHMNGDHYDHSIENLQTICPNCHAQTDTFRGKNRQDKARKKQYCICGIAGIPSTAICSRCNLKIKGYRKRTIFNCIDCKCEISYKAKRCKACDGKTRKNKIEWPSVEYLLNRLEGTSYRSLANELGVSDNAIKQRIENHGSAGQEPPEKQRSRGEAIDRCSDCFKPISSGAVRCKQCQNINQVKIRWPPSEYLKDRLSHTSQTALARELGVNLSSLRKRIRTHVK